MPNVCKWTAINKWCLLLLLQNGKLLYLPVSAMMLQNLGIFYSLSVSRQIMPRLQYKCVNGDSESQNPEGSPGTLVYGSFKTGQELSSTLIHSHQKAAYPQSNLSPVGRPVVFTYYELSNLPVYRLCLCILACFPCYQNLFDLVSSLCSFSLNHIISSLIVSIRINKIDTVTSGCLWGI